MKNMFDKYSSSQLMIFAMEYLNSDRKPGVFQIETEKLFERLNKRGVSYVDCYARVEQCFVEKINEIIEKKKAMGPN